MKWLNRGTWEILKVPLGVAIDNEQKSMVKTLRKSAHFIVPGKQGNACGGKGVAVSTRVVRNEFLAAERDWVLNKARLVSHNCSGGKT